MIRAIWALLLLLSPQEPPPIKAVFFTGGGYHDYKKLAPLLTSKMAERANVTFDIKWDAKGIREADFGREYDLVVYDLCIDHSEGADMVDSILAVTREGKPTVLIHCAAHCFRDKGDEEKWLDFTGMKTRRHDPFQAFATAKASKDHPILKGFPDAWSTPGDELYQTIELHKESTALLTAKSPTSGKEHVVCWVRPYGKGRIFGTTLGHDLKTAGQSDYHQLLTAGLLWAAGKLAEDGTPAKGYGRERGPLADLPGPPGPHVARIQAMGDNAWLELGAPAPDPKWGRARGRSWTSEMPHAPERRGAFLFGEGVHGYAKPDGRYMDDLWFYDLQGHRWICCYPGADTKTLDLALNADGFEPLPVASQVHGYEMNTYDPDLGRLMSMPNPHGYEKKALPQREKWLKPAPEDASPWMYASATGRWLRRRTGGAAPKSSFGDTLIYVPSMKKAFFARASKEVWLYDPKANAWEKPNPQGTPPPFGIDAVSCLDTKRERIYIGGGSYPVAPARGGAFWIYDLKTSAWIDPKPSGAPCGGSNSYPTKNAVLVYDAANDVVLLVMHSAFDDKPERTGVYVYDPAANAWIGERRPLPEKMSARQPKNGFFDPVMNAVFLHSAGDSVDDGVIWVYRYKAAR